MAEKVDHLECRPVAGQTVCKGTYRGRTTISDKFGAVDIPNALSAEWHRTDEFARHERTRQAEVPQYALERVGEREFKEGRLHEGLRHVERGTHMERQFAVSSPFKDRTAAGTWSLDVRGTMFDFLTCTVKTDRDKVLVCEGGGPRG